MQTNALRKRRLLLPHLSTAGRHYSGPGVKNSPSGKRFLWALRLTAVLLLTFCLKAGAAIGAGGITLSVKNAPLEKVFKAIQKQTEYSFVYNNRLIANAKRVDIKVSQVPVEEVLQECFKGQRP